MFIPALTVGTLISKKASDTFSSPQVEMDIKDVFGEELYTSPVRKYIELDVDCYKVDNTLSKNTVGPANISPDYGGSVFLNLKSGTKIWSNGGMGAFVQEDGFSFNPTGNADYDGYSPVGYGGGLIIGWSSLPSSFKLYPDIFINLEPGCDARAGGGGGGGIYPGADGECTYKERYERPELGWTRYFQVKPMYRGWTGYYGSGFNNDVYYEYPEYYYASTPLTPVGSTQSNGLSGTGEGGTQFYYMTGRWSDTPGGYNGSLTYYENGNTYSNQTGLDYGTFAVGREPVADSRYNYRTLYGDYDQNTYQPPIGNGNAYTSSYFITFSADATGILWDLTIDPNTGQHIALTWDQDAIDAGNVNPALKEPIYTFPLGTISHSLHPGQSKGTASAQWGGQAQQNSLGTGTIAGYTIKGSALNTYTDPNYPGSTFYEFPHTKTVYDYTFDYDFRTVGGSAGSGANGYGAVLSGSTYIWAQSGQRTTGGLAPTSLPANNIPDWEYYIDPNNYNQGLGADAYSTTLIGGQGGNWGNTYANNDQNSNGPDTGSGEGINYTPNQQNPVNPSPPGRGGGLYYRQGFGDYTIKLSKIDSPTVIDHKWNIHNTGQRPSYRDSSLDWTF